MHHHMLPADEKLARQRQGYVNLLVLYMFSVEFLTLENNTFLLDFHYIMPFLKKQCFIYPNLTLECVKKLFENSPIIVEGGGG